MNIPGLEQMDSASRSQAVQGYLINEVEKLVKVGEGIKLVLANLEKRIKELEDARTRQIVFNTDISAKLYLDPKPEEKPLQAKVNWLADLLSKWRKKYMKRKAVRNQNKHAPNQKI